MARPRVTTDAQPTSPAAMGLQTWDWSGLSCSVTMGDPILWQDFQPTTNQERQTYSPEVTRDAPPRVRPPPPAHISWSMSQKLFHEGLLSALSAFEPLPSAGGSG